MVSILTTKNASVLIALGVRNNASNKFQFAGVTKLSVCYVFKCLL